MSERYIDDADWATAAEQSSEDDEAQEGNILAEEDAANTPAEHLAVHIVDEDEDEVDVEDLDDIDIDDPEADAIVNDALNIDKTDEAEAAAEVLTDSLAEEAELLSGIVFQTFPAGETHPRLGHLVRRMPVGCRLCDLHRTRTGSPREPNRLVGGGNRFKPL